MRVVAEVPSIEMEVINERIVIGIASSREKSVVFHDCTQSTDPSLFLDNIYDNLVNLTKNMDYGSVYFL